MTQQTLTTDVVIIGAGIAGLWLHNRLNSMGFHALLLENKSIGNAQTLSSQGIIHGGAKYALNGILSKATHAIGDMPARWQACLKGEGDVDLTSVNIFTDHQLLWSKEQLSSKIVSFFASKALSGRMQTVDKSEQPALFQDPNFKGTLYRLDEPVLDIPTVLTALAQPWQDRIMKVPDDSIYAWQYDDDGKVNSLNIDDEITIQAQQFICTAGEGNQALIQSLGFKKPDMQLRPLQMVLCKAKDPKQSLPAIYAHSLGSGSKPIATITSHFDDEDNTVWYIGGNIAEKGVRKSFDDLTKEAHQLLNDILPWFDLPELEWLTHTVNRAEPKQSGLSRPDTAFVESINNVHIAWPTKLALAPDLADSVITKLMNADLKKELHEDPISFISPKFGQTLWNKTFQ